MPDADLARPPCSPPAAPPPPLRRRPCRPVPAALAAAALGWPLLAGAGEHDCVLEPRMSVDVRAPVEGLIEQVLVDRGDRVRVGQTLVVLDSGLEKANLEQARYRAAMVGAVKSGESRVEYATIKLHRREQLAEGRFVSPQDRDEAAAEKRLAESELVQARENQRLAALEQTRAAEQLRLRSVKSTLNGVVTERMAHPGDLADNRDIRKPLLRIADTSVLHVEALLPVAAYRKLTPGTPLEVIPDAPIGGRLSARLKSVDPVIDMASGTVRIRLELPNPDLRLPAGLTCRVEVPGIERGAGGLAAGRSRPPPAGAR